MIKHIITLRERENNIFDIDCLNFNLNNNLTYEYDNDNFQSKDNFNILFEMLCLNKEDIRIIVNNIKVLFSEIILNNFSNYKDLKIMERESGYKLTFDYFVLDENKFENSLVKIKIVNIKLKNDKFNKIICFKFTYNAKEIEFYSTIAFDEVLNSLEKNKKIRLHLLMNKR